MKYILKEEQERIIKMIGELNFANFKANLDLAGLEKEALNIRFEAVDLVYNLECCYNSTNDGMRPTVIEILKGKKVNIDDYFNGHVSRVDYGMDDLSIAMLYLKMLEQQPDFQSTVKHAELIEYMNNARKNILDQNTQAQFAV